MGATDLRFRAMGTDCHVVVFASSSGDALVELARERVELLEQSWSRFRSDSELSRLNAAAGAGPYPVSADLLTLADHMRVAWERTDGLFDPTVLAAMRALGYDADFAAVAARPASGLADVVLAAAPGMAGVHVDSERSTVDLPAGVGLDPGAIGKGLAADIIAEELFGAGADGVLVNLGGDVSAIGHPDDGRPWAIGVEDERVPADDPARILRVLTFSEETDRVGVATSTTLKRRWAQGRRHHVLDPRTGRMSASDLLQVTVVARLAWEAEVTATAALLRDCGPARDWIRSSGLTGILLTDTSIIDTDEEDNHG